MRSACNRWQWSWIFFIAIALTGCEYENPFDKPYTPPKPKRLKRKKKLSLTSKITPFLYIPVKKRDPFRPPFLTSSVQNPKKNDKKPTSILRPRQKRKPRTELEKFELDQIKVVATITGVANPMAMVEGPDGQGFIIRRGTSIGRNGGRVTRIYSTGVVISEVSRDNAGRRVVNRVMVRIKSRKAKAVRGRVQVGGRSLSIDKTGQPQYRSLKRRTDRLFRRRGVGAP